MPQPNLTPYTWPEAKFGPDGEALPANARITTVVLPVPYHLPANNLAYMDQEFRSFLWPRCEKNYLRLSREFHFGERGRMLYARIIDSPKPSEVAA